jgi:hypothetical protein
VAPGLGAAGLLNPNGQVFHRINIPESSRQARTCFADAWRLTDVGDPDTQIASKKS